MNQKLSTLLALLSILLFNTLCQAQQTHQHNQIPNYTPIDKALHDTIVAKDKAYFDAYNSCDMKKQASLYAENLEFFHDKGGLSTSKQDILSSIEKNICGKVTRTLIEGSIEVYPINNYGAVEIGYHKFFNKQEPDAESKPSKFIIIWKLEGTEWLITKVISLH